MTPATPPGLRRCRPRVVAVRGDADPVGAVGRDDLCLGQAFAERDGVDAVLRNSTMPDLTSSLVRSPATV